MHYAHAPANGATAGKSQVGVNLVHSKFLFVTPNKEDAEIQTAIRTTGATIGRGFLNDFDADGRHESKSLETIQFLVCDGPRRCAEGIASAGFVVHVSAKYRPRLEEVEKEFRRRLSDMTRIRAVDGALQAPRYTSAEMYEHAYRHAACRKPGQTTPNAIILPLSKSSEWWSLGPLARHQYFYPHENADHGPAAKGHAMAAEEGVRTIFRRVYHNPDGYQRDGEFDFVNYAECSDAHIEVYDRITAALRDTVQNPEWRFVTEGPEWRGRRVFRW